MRLRTTLALHGSVVEDRVSRLHGVELLELAAPGAAVQVAARGGVLWVDGRPHPEGTATIERGPCVVTLELVRSAPARSVALPAVDVRFALAAAAMMLLFGWLDAATRVIEREPDLAARLASMVVPEGLLAAEVPADDAGRYGDADDTGDVPELRWRPAVHYQE